jgi:hypothetical protein
MLRTTSGPGAVVARILRRPQHIRACSSPSAEWVHEPAEAQITPVGKRLVRLNGRRGAHVFEADRRSAAK